MTSSAASQARVTRVFAFVSLQRRATLHAATTKRSPAPKLLLRRVSAGKSRAASVQPSILPLITQNTLPLCLPSHPSTHPSSTIPSPPAPHRYASTSTRPCDFACQAVHTNPISAEPAVTRGATHAVATAQSTANLLSALIDGAPARDRSSEPSPPPTHCYHP